MQKKMSRLTQTLAMSVTSVLLVSGTVIAGASSASATTCDSVTGLLCGAVKNRTSKRMSITEDLGTGSQGYCDVWNKNGGTSSVFWHAKCDQETIGNGTYGGDGTGKDVDAFSFANQGYHERFSRIGTWHWRTKGVWTKFNSAEIADCGIGDGNEIWCTVLVQA